MKRNMRGSGGISASLPVRRVSYSEDKGEKRRAKKRQQYRGFRRNKQKLKKHVFA